MEAAVIVALAGLAAIGVGSFMAAAAAVIGALILLAARLAICGRTSDPPDWVATGAEEERVGT